MYSMMQRLMGALRHTYSLLGPLSCKYFHGPLSYVPILLSISEIQTKLDQSGEWEYYRTTIKQEKECNNETEAIINWLLPYLDVGRARTYSWLSLNM